MARAQASRERILDGARRALDRYRWQELTTERIADEAGVSRVTLHRHGLTRHVILAELAEQAVRRYRDQMWPVLTDADSADTRLRRALEVLCGLAEENLSLLLALDAQANAAVFHADDEQDALTRDVFTEPLERLLRDGAKEGSVREFDDPAATATVLFNSVGWTYIHLRSGHRWRAQAAARATIDLALNGIIR